ncbi:AraC family transcriptional regulator [Pokkaliibacter sp. MBI-7]|uniref:AraC family transcriptional regulator n=1 Tax=Pokkaliibacter sp. MBI-7 TaxID=3040600 RepID=UPI002447E563|nr:AraC family transcriptional regulator [Pokkaliibacter sp. MBI-7]MDH2432526.1 AraC family transcriptional regulator [Pokkaliibacter sp. MBI-7]
MSQSNAVSPGGDALLQTPLFSPHNQLFLLNDRDAICQHVSGIFKPHELKPRQHGESISASMHHLRRGRLSVNRLEYGTDVHIDPARLDSFYLIQIPLRGSAAIRCGQHQFESTPQLASLISPQLPLSMCWQASAAQLAIRIDQDDMAYHCHQHLPRSRERLPRFDPRLDFSTAGGAYFLQLLKVFVDAVSCDQHPIQHSLVQKQFESALLTALLYGASHDFSQQLDEQQERCVSPYFVKRTEEYIRAHLHEPLSIESLAEQAGVSVRTLYAGFRNFRNTSPMSLLRDLRMEQVHDELLRDAQASVTEVAFKWGFAHLGRFAQDYKRRYGELPSATRRFRHEPD